MENGKYSILGIYPENDISVDSAILDRKGPDGLHLFDRKSGMNILLNELTFQSCEWSKAPRQVSIALTNSCDLSCSFCYAPKKAAILSSSSIFRWAEELYQNGCFGLGFGGGEPTLHSEFVTICNELRKCTGLALSVTTHGHNFTPKMLANLSGSLDLIRLSVDGVGVNYETIRKKSYADFRRIAKEVCQDFRVAINCVVNAQTINDLPAVAQLAMDLNATQLLLLPEVTFGRGQTPSLEILSRLKVWIKEYCGSVPIGISETHKDLMPHQIPLPQESTLSAYAHIDAEAYLRPNSFSSIKGTSRNSKNQY